MRTVSMIYGFRSLGLRQIITVYWHQLQRKSLRHQGLRGVLVNTDPVWRDWAESIGLRNLNLDDVGKDCGLVDLWIIGLQAQQRYPPEFWAGFPGDWLLLGNDLPEIGKWLGREVLSNPPKMGFFCFGEGFSHE
ncbi:hypothetical protein HFQ13_10495 [Acidithiobacillus sp. VAN18-1]|uniref:Uncharacterized protein n=1 Tax=Igneacidithiobacillus copahuensis TaxID=2724909 RepID=A0AAE2YR27_9PROT|nr:hypothetical protein [Igneacidithiobacillus copahuensis]MBU2788619.1 hypothetical protein [Igneacidithiobacillus copahuensis]MBU2796697.1 hypothetical protein [Acidithiobacillus sp. VAN18-2]